MISWWGPMWDVLLLGGTFGIVALFVWATGRTFRAPSTCPACSSLVRTSGECSGSGRDWFRCGR